MDLGEIVEDVKREINLNEMKGKKISIDAYNTIYQFLAAIRQPDGTPLIDSKGRITSHLNGLFYRTISIIESGIIPIFVFDGKPPEKKSEEIERRKRAKEEAEKKLEKAKLEGEYREIRKYAQAAVRLSNEMVEESKKLLDAMGIPVVQAPGEGEAEAAYINSIDLSWAAASQDYDSLLFGAKRLVRNITISGKRKLPNKDVYVEIKPELIELESLLKKLGINREQLIDIAILIGTDYNPDGVKGIGVKTALRIIKKYNNIENAIEKGEIQLSKINFDIREIRKLFITPEVKKPTERLELAECNEREIIELLVKNHDFNEDRVNNGIERLKKAIKEAKSVEKQTGLDQWF
uniref:Flap endonuclease 1 n=1 Tax=Sulfolobus acidocaldarius (strain ATCC 33909 / DSM 639 / JCM 8929 / NBRC 15157 / NCIMB 11770) TaxID=330779 RepID=FEN_SULAC|nr:RecName: Full=Flap endonuclease 1; Short=FEN-1; AltName: Full=Flap structure-specific endonuclease 1 [Sulfolobus acidocaldarius DSM 639]